MSAMDLKRFDGFMQAQLNPAAGMDPTELVTAAPAQSMSSGDDPPTPLVEQDADGKTPVILPGGDMQISDAAREVFSLLGQHRELYLRGDVVVDIKESSGRSAIKLVRAAGLRTIAETRCRFFTHQTKKDGSPSLVKRSMSASVAEALLESREKSLLPEIRGVSNCPVLIERDGCLEVAGPGYNEATGLLVTQGQEPVSMPFEEAKRALEGLLAEFHFQTRADFLRALAMLLTPALKSSGLITGHVPIDVIEADQSQAGKNYITSIKAAVYNDEPALVTKRQGGVGSLEETFSHQLVTGRRFIVLDNVRGSLDSQLIESFLTASGSFPARVPNRGSFDVDPSQFFLSMTSNGAEMTKDLANRANMVRICKQPSGFQYTRHEEGDLLALVKAKQPYYLGCVFSIVQTWYKCGKPPYPHTDHDFRDWAQILGWIVRNMFGGGELLDGHRAAQQRVGNSALVFVRTLALSLREQGGLNRPYTAHDLAVHCQTEGINIPGLNRNQDLEAAAKHIGLLMKKAFSNDDSFQLKVEDMLIERTSTQILRTDGRGSREQKTYLFRRA